MLSFSVLLEFPPPASVFCVEFVLHSHSRVRGSRIASRAQPFHLRTFVFKVPSHFVFDLSMKHSFPHHSSLSSLPPSFSPCCCLFLFVSSLLSHLPLLCVYQPLPLLSSLGAVSAPRPCVEVEPRAASRAAHLPGPRVHLLFN